MNMKLGGLAGLGLVLVLHSWALGQHGAENKAGGAAAVLCPVSGHPVDLFSSTKTDQGPVFFCCSDCIKDFESNKDKYADAVTAQRKELSKLPKAQVTCPVTGEPCDKKILIDVMDQKIYFASEDAKSKYQADPKKYEVALANSYTYQTKCPVMGKPIDPKYSVALSDGNKIYVCCRQCPAKITANPDKFVEKLAAQGFVLDPSKISK